MTDTQDDKRRTRSPEEAAAILGVARSTVYEAVRNGTLQADRVGRRIIIPSVVIERMVSDKGKRYKADV